MAAPGLLWSSALARLAAGALPPYTRELGDSLWQEAEQAAEGMDYESNEASVCGAGNWGDGPQCDQWDQGRSPCWPSAMTVSASWDVDLMARWSVEMAEEFGFANRGQLGPGVNLARYAWNGRLGEYMAGEDPFFGAEMVRSMVAAYRTVEHPPLQTVKHFIPNTIETDRKGLTETVDERTLFEVYYPPFAAAVEAGVSGVMCSYNLVKCTSGLCSGETAYACANDDILNKHLKEIMGFRGIVISDWDATNCVDESVGSGGCAAAGSYVENAYAASAGLDLEMPSCMTFKGGVTERAKEKATRLQWAYLVQGRQFSSEDGRRLQGNSTRRLRAEEEGYCCWWPQPPGDICAQCTERKPLSGVECPEDRRCGGGSAAVSAEAPPPPRSAVQPPPASAPAAASPAAPPPTSAAAPGGAGGGAIGPLLPAAPPPPPAAELPAAAPPPAAAAPAGEAAQPPPPAAATPPAAAAPARDEAAAPQLPAAAGEEGVAEHLAVPGWALRLGAAGLCLEVGAAEGAAGELPLRQRGCLEAAGRQQFSWDSRTSRIHWAVRPSLCLDAAAGGALAPGAALRLRPCLADASPGQVWRIGVGPERGAVRSEARPELCIEASAGGDDAGLQLAACQDGSAAQTFSAGRERFPAAWTAHDAALVAPRPIAPPPPADDPSPAPAAAAAVAAEPAAAPAAAVAAAPAASSGRGAWHSAVVAAPAAAPAAPAALVAPAAPSAPAAPVAPAAPAPPAPSPAPPAPPPPPPPAPAPPPPAPSWSTGVYEENPFGSAAPAPPPAASSQQGPGCPDEGGDNYKSECKLGLADRIIAESAAVLKNDGGVLPLARGAAVALVGSEACAEDPLAQGGGSGWNGFACNEVPKVNVRDGIAALDGVAEPSCSDEAGDADVIVAVVAPAKASEGTDRETLQLNGDDVQLIKKYGSLGKKLVVVINAPGPMITSTWDAVADAILITWLPGQQNGKGIAMALYGETHEASGRLPFTFPKCSTEACSPQDELASVALGDKIATKEHLTFSEKALIGYRWYHARGVEVSYPFGFGLFAYGSAEVVYSDAAAAVGPDSVTISAQLAHRGPREGRDVPQLYVSFPESVPGDAESKPEWVLKGFSKVLLKPGEAASVSFVLPLRELSYWDDSPGVSKWVCAAGEFRACVGANARDAVLPGAGACTRFRPPCGGALDLIDEHEDTGAALAGPGHPLRGTGVAIWAAAALPSVLVASALLRFGCAARRGRGGSAEAASAGWFVPLSTAGSFEDAARFGVESGGDEAP